jgi:hypothetical protein
MKYKIFEKNCEICGKPFRRSGAIDNPPRFCSTPCLHVWRKGIRYEKYIVEDRWLPIIQKIYSEGPELGAVKDLARRIGVPRTKLTNIARSRGWITRNRATGWDYFWCDKELSILEGNPDYAPVSIQRKLRLAGFSRSIGAIEIKRAQLRVTQNRSGMSANDLAMRFGIDVHSILRLIDRGKLKAKRRPGYEADKAAWLIRPEDARQYIIEWLPEVNIAKCDKYWLVDLLRKAA